MWHWGDRPDTSAVGDEPQPAVVGDHPEARMLQDDHARPAPFFGDFILKENLDRFVEAKCVN
jgi:hypothetical protein